MAGPPREGDAPPVGAAAAGWRLALAVVVVAAAAAALALGFRASLGAALAALGHADVVAAMRAWPWWARLALPAAGGLGAGLVGLAVARRPGGGGVGRVMEAVALGTARVPIARTVLQAAAAWLAIAGGNSLGREGPIIQLCAAAGEAARRALRLDDRQGRLAVAAGVAAGFAAAYAAPLAAALFVLEVVAGVAAVELAAPVLAAVALAAAMTAAVAAGGPLYPLPAVEATGPAALAALAATGALAALPATGLLRLLAASERAWRAVPAPWRQAAGGLACGAVLLAVPAVAGNGQAALADLLDGRLAAGAIAVLLLAKPLATAAVVGAGQPGGVFTPTLLLGACAGALAWAGLDATVGAPAPAAAFAVAGLAAALAATTHAPLTAVALAVELTGRLELLVPVATAAALAAALGRRLVDASIYAAELRARGVPWRVTLDGRRG